MTCRLSPAALRPLFTEPAGNTERWPCPGLRPGCLPLTGSSWAGLAPLRASVSSSAGRGRGTRPPEHGKEQCQ